ncbi:hypothetical protein BH23GEM6_BH23GEM6_06470 [soil metagenome]
MDQENRPAAAEPARRRWASSVPSAPVGVLVLAAFLFFVASGSIVGGLYLIFTAAELGWAGWSMLLVAAPVTLYMAIHLMRLTYWAWSAIVIALVLLLISSLLRAIFSPGIPIAALGEIALESLFLFYLSRPRIRNAFRR